MRLSPFIARRYLFSQKSTNVINLISWVSMIGITICSLSFVLILSAFNGFEGLVENLYNSFYPSLKIEAEEGKIFTVDKELMTSIEEVEGVRAASVVLEENGLLVFKGKQQPATLKGVDEQFVQISGLDSAMVYGDTFLLERKGNYFAVLGFGIDQALETQFKDPLNPLNIFIPRRGKGRSFLPTGDFERMSIPVWGAFAIQDEFDNQYAFVPIEVMRNLLNYDNEASAIELSLKDGFDLNDVKAELEAILPGHLEVLSKYQQNALLYRIMNIERLAVYLILTLVLMIVAFNITGSLSMVVIDKKKDISILKTMGATDRTIRNVFLTQGIYQALISLAIGFGVAILLVVAQQQLGLIQIGGSGTFVVDHYPVAMKLTDFVLVALIVLVITSVASWVPANRAARQPKLEALNVR